MKRAVVLAGGGSKGAYEAGFMKALSELGIDYQIVTGTSIGAMNGCLLAQQFRGFGKTLEPYRYFSSLCWWLSTRFSI